MPILAPYKIASREIKTEPTVVRVRSFGRGRRHVGVIAGPCSVESEEQILATAHGRQGGRRHGPARRSLQAAHQPLSFQG